MYAVTVFLRIKPGSVEAFLPLMLENARTSRQTEGGCQQFDVCRDGEEVFLYELYDDRAAFEAHLASTHFKAFDAATGDMIVSKEVRLFEDVMR